MTLRDSKPGRFIRRHSSLHRLVHGTWCRVLGPLDTKRVATTGTGVVNPPGTGPTPPPNPTGQWVVASALDYAKAGFPINTYNTQLQTHPGLTMWYSPVYNQITFSATRPTT